MVDLHVSTLSHCVRQEESFEISISANAISGKTLTSIGDKEQGISRQALSVFLEDSFSCIENLKHFAAGIVHDFAFRYRLLNAISQCEEINLGMRFHRELMFKGDEGLVKVIMEVPTTFKTSAFEQLQGLLGENEIEWRDFQALEDSDVVSQISQVIAVGKGDVSSVRSAIQTLPYVVHSSVE
jgi:hypothetical protein